MNKYELLQEENARFWESLDVNNTALSAEDFALLAEEEMEALALEAIAI